jgi:small subunit ribosomal protein S2
MPYVTNRWLGGMLTNWRTIRQRVNELDRLERMRDQGEFTRITKKEALILQRKMDRLEYLLGGIRKMTGLPNMVFVVDVYREATAIHEANLLQIPVIAMVDTNCDPRTIDYIIPSNDDAIRAIKLLVGTMADAVMEGKAMRKEEEFEAMPEEAAMAISEEPELSDEELLGEATLAKLPSRQLVAESDSDSDEVVAELDETAEADAEAEELTEAAVEAEMVIEEEIVPEEEAEADAEAEELTEAAVEAEMVVEEEIVAEEEAEADAEAEELTEAAVEAEIVIEEEIVAEEEAEADAEAEELTEAAVEAEIVVEEEIVAEEEAEAEVDVESTESEGDQEQEQENSKVEDETE